MPSKRTKKFVLLEDLRDGADGRVWLACTLTGFLCVLKFPKKPSNEGGSIDMDEKLEREKENWEKMNQLSAFIKNVGGRSALIMPYVKCNFSDEKPPSDEDVKKQARALVHKFVDNGKWHQDIAWRHLGTVSPIKKGGSKRMVAIDLTRVENVQDPTAALNDMLGRLKLN